VTDGESTITIIGLGHRISNKYQSLLDDNSLVSYY
jgi:hypothetical protein